MRRCMFGGLVGGRMTGDIIREKKSHIMVWVFVQALRLTLKKNVNKWVQRGKPAWRVEEGQEKKQNYSGGDWRGDVEAEEWKNRWQKDITPQRKRNPPGFVACFRFTWLAKLLTPPSPSPGFFSTQPQTLWDGKWVICVKVNTLSTYSAALFLGRALEIFSSYFPPP